MILYNVDSNGQYLAISDEIDKIRSQKNQGKIQIGQWCYEINVGTAEETPAIFPTTDHGKIHKDKFVFLIFFFAVSSTILPNTSIIKGIVVYKKTNKLSDLFYAFSIEKQSKGKGKSRTTTSKVTRCQPSYQPTTIDQSLLNISESKGVYFICSRKMYFLGGSTELCLLHPFKERFDGKTDRSPKLIDCLGKPPVLIVVSIIIVVNKNRF